MAAPARYREFRELLRYSPHAGTRIAHGQRCQCRLLENAAPQHLGRASSVTCCPTGRTKGACGPQAGYAAQSTITYGAARRAGTSEVCVTGGVDDVELDALPSHRSHLGHDGDACARTRRGGRQGMRTKTALKASKRQSDRSLLCLLLTALALEVQGVHGAVTTVVVVNILFAGVEELVNQRGLSVVDLKTGIS